MTELQQQLITIVNEIPDGYVASFGAVAKELMKRSQRTITAQLVGWQLSGLPEHQWHELPRWRVINKAGYVSSLKLGTKGLKQISLLGKEGYEVISGYVQDPQWREF